MRSLWNRIGQLVSGSRRRTERLPVAVDEVPAGDYFIPADWSFNRDTSDDVLRLLHRNLRREVSGPRSGHTQSTGPLVDAGPGIIPGDGAASWTSIPGTYRYIDIDIPSREPAGYSDVTIQSVFDPDSLQHYHSYRRGEIYAGFHGDRDKCPACRRRTAEQWAAGYSHATLGGWTVAIGVDCE